MSRPLTEYTNQELLGAVRASAKHVGYPYNDILAEMNRRVLAIEAKVKALKIWTVVMIAVAVLVFIIQPTYMGTRMLEPELMTTRWPWIFPILGIGVLWFVGVIVLLVAGRLGAFHPADPITASRPGAKAEGPPPEPPAFLRTWDWRQHH